MENDWDQKFAQKYCHLKETHFQGSGAGLLSALVESLRFVALPPVAAHISHNIATRGEVWETNRQCLLKHRKNAKLFVFFNTDTNTYVVYGHGNGCWWKGCWYNGKVSTSFQSTVSDGWLPIYIFWIRSQPGTRLRQHTREHIQAAINPNSKCAKLMQNVRFLCLTSMTQLWPANILSIQSWRKMYAFYV